MPRTSPYSYGDYGNQLRRSLSKAEGFELTGPFTGKLSVGPEQADVRLEADGSLRVELATAPPTSCWEALELSGGLNGNVRMACHARDSAVVADTQVDGQLHLNESFRQIRDGIMTALHWTAPVQQSESTRDADSAEAVAPEAVEQALGKMDAAPDSLVKHDHEWELRTRLAGEIVPVQLSIERHDLVVRNVVASPTLDPKGFQREEPAHYALWLNGRLRHARLAVHDGRLVAEARLHSKLISPYWIRLSTSAVASAAHYAVPALRVLLHQTVVRQLYAWLFSVRSSF